MIIPSFFLFFLMHHAATHNVGMGIYRQSLVKSPDIKTLLCKFLLCSGELSNKKVNVTTIIFFYVWWFNRTLSMYDSSETKSCFRPQQTFFCITTLVCKWIGHMCYLKFFLTVTLLLTLTLWCKKVIYPSIQSNNHFINW